MSTAMGNRSVVRAINPATEETIAEYAFLTEQEIRDRLNMAEEAYSEWREAPLEDRARTIRQIGRLLVEQNESLAELITSEMGKPIRQSQAELTKCAWLCDFFADKGSEFLQPEEVDSDAERSFVRFDPLGPVLAIMPWNFPFWQAFRCAVPGILAGNVFLLKHALNVPGCAEAMERLFHDAGVPKGVFTNFFVDNRAAEALISDAAVRAVTLTGSVRAGSAVGAAAGRAIKKCVLELGGSDPFIVLADAPIQDAADKAVAARTQNAGQSCIAAKRFIVVEQVLEEFTRQMIGHVENLVVGDPSQPETEVGPLAREDLREHLHDQVRRSLDAGARLECGGEVPQGRGYFYPPTVLSGVEPGMAAFDEETFGPLAAIIAARDEEHALELANRSEFGLGASIWTKDTRRATELASRIEAGNVFINEVVKSDPRLPFGGVKNSGYGRELSAFGIREFVNIKTVWVK